MEKEHKWVLAKISLFFSLWMFFIFFIIYFIIDKFYLSEHLFYLIAFFAFLVSLFGGYMLALFFLNPIFQTNKFLDRLLKDTLHELNIPVATIKANAQMIKTNPANPKNIKRIERIEKSCDDLLQLYKGMDYYIKREIEQVDKEVFNLRDVCEESIKKFKEITKDIKISAELKDIKVKADKVGFIKVLDNLISNAIKYNKPGGYVKIILKNEYLMVEDGGIGMDSSELFRVFDRHYQADESKSGYGLGLNIVKSYCDKEKIYINIDSEKGVGSKFKLSLKNIRVE